MAAGTKDIVIEQGATYRLGLEWRQPGPDAETPGPVYDLTGCTAQMVVRDRVGGTVLIDLTSDAGAIVLGGTAGTIDLVIDYTETGALTVKKAVYDLFVVFPVDADDAAIREKVLKGRVAVDLSVTPMPGVLEPVP